MFHPLVWACDRTPPSRAYVPPGAAALLQLAPRCCHWPIGDVDREDFRFCLAPSGQWTYCPQHRALALRGRR
ncbi:GcrA family cell cycle regulator [Lichenifustis flavocetrariae]|uniref:Uncharacterized protein n=1 Tax=Lichenifustis flavocetrariae TaxID=2949735 RepID=A0AA42CJ79_9HYPH|nr:GcrA family cell cycle regulator [Lichenifustis flavocetrariae]MCW6507726.1 hypothetical protein [Lichenifustis flavocetrariae]